LAILDGLKLPKGRISGRALAAVVTAVRRTPARGPLAQMLRTDLGIDRARALGAAARGHLPHSFEPVRARDCHHRVSEHLASPAHSGAPRSAAELQAAYLSGSHDPVQVTTRALAAARRLAHQSPSLGPLSAYDDESAEKAAHESAARFKAGAPLSALDGVPIAIKEEVHQRGHRARLGTSFLKNDSSSVDACAVARLRAAGALIIGQTPMTEFGLSPLGGNQHRRMPRNPHDGSRLAGGSSTGSAVAVATGVTPVSLGCDGGGSIRIPAALCGVFGLKPTYGRIPAVGLGLPGATSVVHIGPLAVSSSELASFVELASGGDAGDSCSLRATAFGPQELSLALRRGVRGLRIGVDESEWAAAPSDLVRPCRAALIALEAAGAELVPIRIPTAAHAAAIGYLTIGIEAFTALHELRQQHMDAMGADLQLFLSGIETFRPDDYVDAQRLRQGLRRDVAEVLRRVDLIALPATARSAPQVTEEEARYGFVDPPLLDGMCRYAFLANLTGLPAASAPVGRDNSGMPVGLQLIGDAWDEACVLQAVAGLERLGIARAIASESTIDLLA
jgi:Asp-tRNA(Asn)/Glu-tRNA(Gln) amidotransferase A subunit family amidase